MYGLGQWQYSGGAVTMDPFQATGFGPVQITSGFAWPSSVGLQLSIGGIVADFGDWVKTTAGELVRIVVDELGRRVVQKTGEVIASTSLGPSTAYAYERQQLQSISPVLIGAAVLVVGLVLSRRI